MNCESVTASEHVGAPLSLDKGALGVVPKKWRKTDSFEQVVIGSDDDNPQHEEEAELQGETAGELVAMATSRTCHRQAGDKCQESTAERVEAAAGAGYGLERVMRDAKLLLGAFFHGCKLPLVGVDVETGCGQGTESAEG